MHSECYYGSNNNGTKRPIPYGGVNSSNFNKNNHHAYNGSPQNLNPRRNNFRNKISFIKADSSRQKSSLDDFTENLKKNLYVDPLPII